MKISRNKKSVKASEEFVVVEEQPVVLEPQPKTIACELIMNAIEALSQEANTDDISREAIANLSVVALTLKSGTEL